MHASILLGLLPVLALATPAFPIRRADELDVQDCSEVPGHKACGVSCIESTFTCCSDGSGGCPAGTYCAVGDNDQMGCCPEGHVCGGDGGVATTIITLSTSDEATSTIVVDVTSTDEATVSATVTADATSTTETPAGPTLIESSASEDATATVTTGTDPVATPAPSATEEASTSATAYTTSTIYTTTVHTITSCPASHPCTAGASTPVVLVTETIAVSTTICPVVESPPLPTPTNLPTTTASPVPKPSVVCPGQGKNCYSASSAVVKPTKSATGTGAYHPPSPTGKPVTAGAGKATFGLAAVVAAFAALL